MSERYECLNGTCEYKEVCEYPTMGVTYATGPCPVRTRVNKEKVGKRVLKLRELEAEFMEIKAGSDC